MLIRRLKRLCRSLILSGLAAVGLNAQAAGWTITDLGAQTYPSAINNLGQIAGGLYDINAVNRAFIYSKGAMTVDNETSWANGINDAGQAVGWVLRGTTASIIYHPIVYKNGVKTELVPDSDASGIPFAINANGQIVGWSNFDNTDHAMAYSDGSFSILANNGFALGINNVGQVVGSVYDNDGTSHGFIYDKTSVKVMPGNASQGNAINNAGQAVGQFTNANGQRHAFVFSNGGLLDVTPNADTGEATAINNNGQIVGQFIPTGSSAPRAFLYNAGNLTDLNFLTNAQASGWQLSKATAINDAGQIVGTGTLNGQPHGFLLTPVSPIP